MKFWIACLTVLFVALLIWLAFSREFSKAITDFTNPTTEEPAPTGPGDKRVFGTCQDVQGNIYPTIAIGNQVWMADNLRNTTTACGDSLSLKFVDGLERGPGVKLYVTEPRYAYYENDTTPNLGVIYNHAAFLQCSICPEGYRIPTKDDWQDLVDALGGKAVVGKRLLPEGDSGFNAVLAGRIDDFGSVLGGEFVFWWSATMAPTKREIEAYAMEVSGTGEIKIKGHDARMGAYVRCLRDKHTTDTVVGH